jgi:hypothetical protein
LVVAVLPVFIVVKFLVHDDDDDGTTAKDCNVFLLSINRPSGKRKQYTLCHE